MIILPIVNHGSTIFFTIYGHLHVDDWIDNCEWWLWQNMIPWRVGWFIMENPSINGRFLDFFHQWGSPCSYHPLKFSHGNKPSSLGSHDILSNGKKPAADLLLRFLPTLLHGLLLLRQLLLSRSHGGWDISCYGDRSWSHGRWDIDIIYIDIIYMYMYMYIYISI